MTHRFRVLKSSWGIVIDLSLRLTYPGHDKLVGAMLAARDIYFSVADKNFNPSLLNWLQRGIADIASLVNRYKEERPLCIEVEAIDYSLSDFQPEGLYCAIQDAILSHFGLIVPGRNISFNEELNRYCFHDLGNEHVNVRNMKT